MERADTPIVAHRTRAQLAVVSGAMKGLHVANVALLSALGAFMGCRSTPQPHPQPRSTAPSAVADGASSDRPDVVTVASAEDASAIGAQPSRRALEECRVLVRNSSIGRRALLTSVTMKPWDGDLAVAWIVPPLFAHGGDDLAARMLSAIEYNDSSEAELQVNVLDEEEPSTARGLTRSPTNIQRVYLARSTAGNLTTGTDQLSRDDNGNELIECGEFSVMSASVDDTGSDDVARNIVPGAPYYCRTAFDAAQPFVLGLRTAPGAPQPSAQVKFFATRATSAPADRSRDFWPLEVDAALVRRSRNPASALRNFSPEGLEIVEVENQGYAVAFRYRGQLRFGWLDTRLRPQGDLYTIATLGNEPGKPRLAAVNGAVLLLVADRPSADAGPSKYQLYGTIIPVGAAPSALVRVATGMDGAQHEFAPAATRLQDGRVFIAWSYGPLEAHSRADRQDVYIRPFDSTLSPIGEPLRLTEASGSDPRIGPIYTRYPDVFRVAVVWGEGTGLQRPLVSAVVGCDPLTNPSGGAR